MTISDQLKILILDDDDDYADFLSRLLVQKGLVVERARDAREAFDKLIGSNYNAILVDGLLPDKNGIEFIKEVREWGYKEIIIFVSAFWKDMKTFRMLKDDYKVSAVLQKPISAEAVYFELSNYLRPGGGLPQPEPAEESQTESTADEEFMESCHSAAAEYLAGLPQKIDSIKNLVEAFQDQPQLDLLKDIRFIAHKIAGSAGIYGLSRIGNLSAKVEVMLFNYLDGVEDFNKVNITEISAIISSIAHELNDIKKEDLVKFVCDYQLGSEEEAFNLLFVPINAESIELYRRFESNSRLAFTFVHDMDEISAKLDENWHDALVLEMDSKNRERLYTLAARTKGRKGSESLPIIFIFDDPSETTQLNALRSGGASFLFKPLDAEDLLESVTRLSSSRKENLPKVLILDDDEEFCIRVVEMLKEIGANSRYLLEPLNVIEEISDYKPDLIIVDILMPYINGIEIANLIKANPFWQELPLVFVSGQTSSEVRIASYKSGAEDFIQKPIIKEEFLTRVKLRLEKSFNYRNLNSRDSLTGLLARKSYSTIAEFRLVEAMRNNGKLSLVLLDIDDFKKVNDSYGHLVGDRVLSVVGRLLGNVFRKTDICCRWGGEEFAVLVDGGRDIAKMLFERLQIELSSIIFDAPRDNKFKVTLSGGVCEFPSENQRLLGLIDIADKRMYISKKNGKNMVTMSG